MGLKGPFVVNVEALEELFVAAEELLQGVDGERLAEAPGAGEKVAHAFG